MPELTVSMPAYNSDKYIKQAIDSVLKQEGIEFELIVVDDGSQDNTRKIVGSYHDARIRLIRNEKRMGIGYCHNLVIEESRSPFIAHVDSDDMVLPGAFRKLVSAIAESSRIGQAHCYFFLIDDHGAVTRNDFRAIRRHMVIKRPPDMDYRKDLLVRGSVMNHLRTYRKEIFEVVGFFSEKVTYGIDHHMALRIVDKYDIKLVPEFLYAHRVYRGSTSNLRWFQGLRFWWQRLCFALNLVRNEQISFPKQKEYNLTKLMSISLFHVLNVPSTLSLFKKMTRISESTLGFLKEEFLTPIGTKLYRFVINHFSWWSINLFEHQKANQKNTSYRIVYYLWRFPTLTQTFIRRELLALLRSGISVEVVADERGDMEFDDEAQVLKKGTYYLTPKDDERLVHYRRRLLKKHPLRYLHLFFYVICHKYEETKKFRVDKLVFNQSIYLAGILEDKNINHIHSPWANQCAFVALVASKFLGIPYTVQARAYDIHRREHGYALPEKFENAALVLTNSLYNKSYIEVQINGTGKEKIHHIYNGIDLKQFEPEQRNGKPKKIRLLSVARLSEQKGFLYLLAAYRKLKDRGYAFQCRIVGGRDAPLNMNYYIQLKQIYHDLGLENCVHFTGPLKFTQVLEHYRWADIFVLPCVTASNGGKDITPNALIEAMAMKLPVVSTDISAIPEIVDNGTNGLLVTPNDTSALVEAIAMLIEDDALRFKLAENARAKVEQRFDIDKNIKHYVELFNNVRPTAR